MIKQKINGKTVNTVMADGSVADITALSSILEGELTIWDKKFEGGVSANPSPLNAKKFSVGKKYLGAGASSASVQIPHIKASKSFNDIRVAVIGQFDEGWESSVKCEYSNLFYDKKGA
ncbi:hypothetical protein SUSP_001246 [Sulfurospirillum sp. 'SP']|nr:hypothetical protein [Sulfurospirillum sp. 'SP']WNY98828.1 hypothetical protein SUSP_001246 [Sulfurospirillum sp. 'SP']